MHGFLDFFAVGGLVASRQILEIKAAPRVVMTSKHQLFCKDGVAQIILQSAATKSSAALNMMLSTSIDMNRGFFSCGT